MAVKQGYSYTEAHFWLKIYNLLNLKSFAAQSKVMHHSTITFPSSVILAVLGLKISIATFGAIETKLMNVPAKLASHTAIV